MLYDKVLGALCAAACADAMGTPLESRPVYLIKQDLGNGGFVYDYLDAPKDSFAPNMKKGQVSDDFSVSFATLEAVVKHGGFSREAAVDGLLAWVHDPKYVFYSSTFMGPTTKVGIAKLEGTFESQNAYTEEMECDQKTITNGASMKAWVAGILNPGNVEKAIDDALTMGFLTHNNVIALSGATALAAAVAVAMKEDATLDQIVEAGIYGAETGYQKALTFAKDAAGASVAKRIPYAVKIGLRYAYDFEGCVNEMTDIIGTGLFASEAVPSAFGFLVSAGGDIMETIYRAINAGNDADTTAVIAASMAGAFKGFSTMKDGQKHLKFLSETNNMDIEQMAKDICALIEK